MGARKEADDDEISLVGLEFDGSPKGMGGVIRANDDRFLVISVYKDAEKRCKLNTAL